MENCVDAVASNVKLDTDNVDYQGSATGGIAGVTAVCDRDLSHTVPLFSFSSDDDSAYPLQGTRGLSANVSE